MTDEITTVPCRPCSVLAHWECEEDQCPCALAGHSETLPMGIFE